MEPKRAQELLNHITVMKNGWVMKTIECSNIRKHMTTQEIEEVETVWKTLDGSSSFHSALSHIAHPKQVMQ